MGASTSGPTALVPTGAAYFVYDERGQLLGEYDAAGNPIYETIYLGSSPVGVLKQSGTAAGNNITLDLYNVFADHLATPRMITRQSDQAIVWRWDTAEAFGATAANQNPSALGPFTFNPRFPGQVFDAETGLLQNWHREYDPRQGRYRQSDPIGLAGGINTYAYALGAPTMYTDANGLSPLKIIAICAKGYRVIKEVGLKEAIQAARRGENVMAGSHAEAKQIARAASNGKKPIRDPAHKPDEGQRPHYHANPRNGGHIFYSLAAAVTVSHYVQCEDKDNPCVEGVLGQVADFFNPLSAGQDIVDIVGGGPD